MDGSKINLLRDFTTILARVKQRFSASSFARRGLSLYRQTKRFVDRHTVPFRGDGQAKREGGGGDGARYCAGSVQDAQGQVEYDPLSVNEYQRKYEEQQVVSVNQTPALRLIIPQIFGIVMAMCGRSA